MSAQTYQPISRAESGTTSAASHVRGLRVAGLLLLLLAAGFLTVITLGGSIAPGYDYAGGAISDLGVIPETAVLFNATLLAVGLLNIAGGYLFYRWHGRSWILVTFVVAGIGAIGAGLFPLSTGNFHGLSALAGFVFFNLEALAAATVLPRPMNVISAGAGLIGLVFVVLMAIGDAGYSAAFGAIGHGGTERMIVYPVMLWLLVLGGYLIAVGSHDDGPAVRNS